MRGKFIITKVTFDAPKVSKKKQKKVVDELKRSVFSDTSKDSLSYYIAAELERKGITILDLKITRVA